MAPPTLPQLLEQLSELLGRMCTEAATNLRGATAGLLDGRLRLAEKIVEGKATMRVLGPRSRRRRRTRCCSTPPSRATCGRGGRAIRASGDLERMGVLARHVAEAALRRGPVRGARAVRPAFAEMGRLAVAMAHKAAEVVRTRNVLLAVELGPTTRRWTPCTRGCSRADGPVVADGIAAAVDVTLLARYYERFADHAVMVANETVTAVTGRRPREVAEFLQRSGSRPADRRCHVGAVPSGSPAPRRVPRRRAPPHRTAPGGLTPSIIPVSTTCSATASSLQLVCCERRRSTSNASSRAPRSGT